MQHNDTKHMAQRNIFNCDTQHKKLSIMTHSISISIITLSVAIFYSYAECHYADCRYAECHYADCRYAKCRYAE